MNQEQRLIELIGESKFKELSDRIPEKFKQTRQINFSDYLMTKSHQEVLDFYSSLINDNSQWTIPKLSGSVIILTSHIYDLLIKLVETREEDQNLINKIKKLHLHYLILFCTERYNISKDYFEPLMELKHFRNMIAHDFDDIMETSFHQAINPIAKGHLLIIVLLDLIKENKK